MNFWRRLGIRRRLALLYLSIFAVGISVFCAVLFQYFQNSQTRAFDTSLYNFGVDITSSLEVDFVGRLFLVNSQISEAGKLLPFHLGGSFFEIRDLKGRVLWHSRSLQNKALPLAKETLARMENERAIFQTIHPSNIGLKSDSPDLRLLTLYAHHKEWNQPLIVQIAVPLDLPRRERRDLLLFFFIGIPTFLLVAGVGGIFLSKLALLPVHNMTQKARGISGVGNLKERIPVPATRDEIRELAMTFNGLLDRLDKAFASQDRFISNASHQLKTPLTILKGELDLLRKGTLSEEALKQGLDSAAVELNRLIQLVQDLLLLARLEAGQDTIELKPVPLDEVVMKVVARLQKLARNKQVLLKTHFLSDHEDAELEVSVNGDEDLLDSMLENFVENAIKYAPHDSAVELFMRSLPEKVEVRVRDAGPGIPEELRQKIFERFTRVQPSNIIPGSGLGLSIASEIARLHGVEIELTAAEPGPGTDVTLTFRKVASAV